MLRLYIEDDAGNVRVVPLGDDLVTIGRALDNTLVLADRNVSRHHARIRQAEGRAFLSDPGSRYGIRIDGGRLAAEIEIRPGDVFVVGDFHLKLLAPDNALSEAAPIAAVSESSRRSTVVDAPAMPETESPTSPGKDVGMMTLQEMEEVARLGWHSDFNDEDEPAARKRAVARILLLLLLVVMAAGLGFAYYRLYVAEDDFLVQPRTYAAAQTAPESAKPAPVQSPAPVPSSVPQPAPVPAPVPRADPVPAPKAPVEASQPQRSPEAAPVPARATERPVREASAAPVPASTPRPAAPAAAAPAPAPAPAPAAGGDSDVAARIDDEIASGNLDEAERLLSQCAGKGCFRRAKGLGDAWQSRGGSAKAISAYKRAMQLTQDPTTRARLAKLIETLGGSPD